MSDRPFSIEIDTHGLERRLSAAPELVTDAIDMAGDDARDVLGPAIDRVTPVDTGLLLSQIELIVGPGFRVTYVNETPYAVYVNARQQYVERGVASQVYEVEAIYDLAIYGVTRIFDT